MAGDDDRRDLIAEPLGGDGRRDLGIRGGESVEQIARRRATGAHGTIGDDLVDQPPPAPAKAGAGQIGRRRHGERQQEIGQARTTEPGGVAQDHLAQFRAVMPHVEREDRAADDLQREPLEDRHEIDRTVNHRESLGQPIRHRDNLPRQEMDRPRRKGGRHRAPLLPPILA